MSVVRKFKEKLVSFLLVEVGTVVTINSQSIRQLALDKDGYVTRASGTVVVTDGGAGYSKGCTYVKTDVGAGSDGTYTNIGTTASCQFVLSDPSSGATTTFNIGTDQTFTKEVNHNVIVTTSTTTNTAGGNLAEAAGAGNGTGAGGTVSVTGGASGAGATGNGGPANITGGAALSTNGNGGSIVLTGGAKNGSGIAGGVRVGSILIRTQAVPTAKTTSGTLTAAELLAGIITINQGAAGTSAQQLPTGTAIVAALPADFATGESFDVSIMNLSTVDAEDASITTNTDLTLVGEMDFQAHSALAAQGSSGILRFRRTGATTFTVYRIA